MEAGTSKSVASKLEKYEPIPIVGCWLWLGAVDKDGYGVIAGSSYGVRWRDKAHRVSFEYFKKPIPSDLHVLHHCDQPGCINPNHLFLGTPKDNAEDKARKGRTKFVRKFGPDNPMYGKTGSLNPFYGKKHTDETKAKIGNANRKHPK